jgi:UDP-N-acetylmuramate: L-alanyl-gamma-D-glutamyl-meso-diaminopimelate ligase
MQSFSGAARRLELIHNSKKLIVYRDFAHSPSKLKGTVKAVKQQYPDKKVVAVFELHTFSSLDRNFLPQYQHSMDDADVALVYFDEETLKQKNRILEADAVQLNFGRHVTVFNQPDLLKDATQHLINAEPTVLLLMSSGTFGGINWSF